MKKEKGSIALFWSSADKILTNGFLVIISIVLARLINPSEYGIIATAQIFTVIFLIFVEPGMTSALIQKKYVDELDFSTILVFNLFLGGVLYSILFVLSDKIGIWFELPVLAKVIKILGFQLLIGGINSVQIAYVQRQMLFKKYFICSFISVFVGAVVGVGLAYKGAGVWALVSYVLVRQFINVMVTLIIFKCIFNLKFSVVRFREMFPFASKILYTKFIDQGYMEATQTIISKIFSPTDLALYNKGKSFPDLVINNLNEALTRVIFPYFSSMQDDKNSLLNSMRMTVQMISYICIPIMIGFVSCAESFVNVLLTNRWSNCVVFLQLCCIYNICIPISNVIRQSLKSIGKSEQVLKIEIIKTFLCIMLLIICLIIYKSPLAIALSISMAYTISLFIECIFASKHLGYRLRYIIKDCIPSFLVSCFMGIIVFMIGKINISIIFKLIFQVIFGVVIYFFITYILNFKQLKILKSYLLKKS